MATDKLDLSAVLDLNDMKLIHPLKAEFLIHLDELVKRRDAGENVS